MNIKCSASLAHLAVQYRNIKIKLSNTTQNIKFNKDCIRHDIIPRYVQVKIRNKSYSAQRTKSYAEKLWIRNEIKYLYRKKCMLNTLLFKKYLELSNNAHPAELPNLLRQVECSVSSVIRKKKSILNKKLTDLINCQKSKEQVILFDFEFYPRTINKTNITFDDEEINVLDKGLKYNLPRINKHSIFNDFIDAECAIRSITDDEAQNIARVSILNKIKNKNRPKKLSPVHKHDILVLKRIKNKLITNDAIICKADKGNTSVILYKKDYINKVEEFINNNEIKLMNKDPTSQFQKRIKKLINDSKVLFTPEEIKTLKNINPRAPVLRGLPKFIRKAFRFDL
jgi:hypothetical protein